MTELTTNTAKIRFNLYAWFSEVLYHPREELLQKEFLSVLAPLCKEYLPESEEKANEIKSIDRIEKDIHVDYTRLFIGADSPLAPPYESYYLNSKRVNQKSAYQVKNVYKHAGFELSNDLKDLPDHVVVELYFMSVLCEQEAVARENGDIDKADIILANQKYFYETHLNRWLKQYIELTIEHANTKFYSYVASVLLDFIDKEAEYFTKIRKDPLIVNG